MGVTVGGGGVREGAGEEENGKLLPST